MNSYFLSIVSNFKICCIMAFSEDKLQQEAYSNLTHSDCAYQKVSVHVILISSSLFLGFPYLFPWTLLKLLLLYCLLMLCCLFDGLLLFTCYFHFNLVTILFKEKFSFLSHYYPPWFCYALNFTLIQRFYIWKHIVGTCALLVRKEVR